jgi:hypothetical protein
VKVLVRPLFYEDIAEEVSWLLEKAGLEVARLWTTILRGTRATSS